MNLVKTGTRHSKEDLGFMLNCLLKCKRRGKKKRERERVMVKYTANQSTALASVR